MIDNHRIVSTIGIIDMLHPVYIRSYWKCVNTLWLNKYYASNTDISFGILCNIPSLSYVFSLHMHAP